MKWMGDGDLSDNYLQGMCVCVSERDAIYKSFIKLCCFQSCSLYPRPHFFFYNLTISSSNLFNYLPSLL